MYDSREQVSLAAVIAEGSQASRIVDTGRPIGAVSVQRLTPGATFHIRIGNAQWIPVSAPFAFFGFDPLNEGKQGLFIRNDTAQAGATFDMVIGYISDVDRLALEAARAQV